ncbi:hypothetical protein T261_01632 [Streptomyces lydicus]|nr:hypothetical protein T261_01632 [Streptomyces lydicus]
MRRAATAAARNPERWVIDPVKPGGQAGVPREVRTRSRAGAPATGAVRAGTLPVANSACRAGTAHPTQEGTLSDSESIAH